MREWRLQSLFSLLLPLCFAGLSRRETVFSENQAWDFEVTFDADGNAHYTAVTANGDPYIPKGEHLLAGGGCSFSYNDSLPNGPSHWAYLCGTEWQACGMYRQSPVDLIQANAVQQDSLFFTQYYDPSTNGAVENNHHTLVAVMPQSTIGGKVQRLTGGPLTSDYQLLQFHYHTPSEHLLEGVVYPLELHLVHNSLTNPNDYAVIGFMFDMSRDFSSPVLDILISASQSMVGNVTEVSWNIPLNSLLPVNQSKEYFNYLGSLTTPPCSEVVTWYVMTHPLHASASQLAYFQNFLGVNARPTLSLGSRVVNFYTPPVQTIFHGQLPPGAIAGITLLLLALFFGVIAYFVFSVKHTRLYFLGKDTGWNYVGFSNGCLKKGKPIEAQSEGEEEDDDAPVQRKRTKGKREAGTELAAMEESDRGALPSGTTKKGDEAAESDDEQKGKGDVEAGGIGGKKGKKVEDDDDDYIPQAKKSAKSSSQKGAGGRRGS